MSDSSESNPTCGMCECFEDAFEYTPCCHEILCDEHINEMMVKSCSIEDCENHSYDICRICLDINDEIFLCDKCQRTFCEEHNVAPYICQCNQS